ncbi:hypothetical protein ALT761_01960 [Alteromonas sp. 76-1]|uniref:hypothetical protein n=1 Tax=Alteromonas sp. 76-1 TaxID=2358187 RepID=UPI000FD173A6|nr:hypothetical protein [Alteromonas sp. 76-1]VEL96961.1 hypothetical protein ALT761_01960 [Alteromonas sp. 76-1]
MYDIECMNEQQLREALKETLELYVREKQVSRKLLTLASSSHLAHMDLICNSAGLMAPVHFATNAAAFVVQLRECYSSQPRRTEAKGRTWILEGSK